MRRSWAIVIVTLIFVCGGSLAAASPAAATSWPAGGPAAGPLGAMVQPGGPAGRMASGPQEGPAPFAPQTTVTSTNWSGYAATGSSGQFTGVSSNWTEPTAKCTGFGDQYSAFWVGLDGFSSSTVEQTGSEADCAGRTAEYSAWYEMYPAYPVYFSNRVRPGDNFTGSVAYHSNTGDFVITLTDSTQKWTQTVSRAVAGAVRSSAEVIAEAPSSGISGGVLPLTNFGRVNFSAATVNGGQLCRYSPVEILMPSVSVSSISGCANFSVSYTGGGAPPWPYL
jgi:hypothetical protein